MLDPFGVPINQNDPNYYSHQQNYYGPQFGSDTGNQANAIPSLEETTGGYSGYGKNSFASKKRDFFDTFYSMVDGSLLTFKLFYFFFAAAFGSIFPLISIYFKQLGMSPIQTGFLGGSRQAIEALIIPFWCHIADKWKRAKQIFIASLFFGLVFTISIGFVRPSPSGCLVSLPDYGNGSTVSRLLTAVHKPWMRDEVTVMRSIPMNLSEVKKIGQSPLDLRRDLITPLQKVKQLTNGLYSPEEFDREKPFLDPLNYPEHTLVMPLYSTVVYSRSNIYIAFTLLMLLTIFGELLTSPAIPLADVSVSQYLGEENKSHLQRQKVFGSIGVALAMFSIGLALDHSNIFPDHPCLESGKRERNYMICFAMYSVFMILSLVLALRFSFYSEGDQESMHYKMFKDKLARIFLKRQTKARSKLVNEEEPNGPSLNVNEDDEEEKNKRSTEDALERVFLEREQRLNLEFNIYEPSAISHLRLTKWKEVAGEFRHTRFIIFLIVVVYMGIGIGLVFTFLFWHMQEFKGSPTLFGIASIINHLSEIFAMYFLEQLMNKIGCVNLIFVGLLSNVFRFLYVSWITNPWWILPVEFLQGLTHSGIMTAFCGYIGQNFEQGKHRNILGFIRGIHFGVGRALGSVIGGILTSIFGSAIMFRVYGITSLAVLAFFFLSEMFLDKRKSCQDEIVTENIGEQSNIDYSQGNHSINDNNQNNSY